MEELDKAYKEAIEVLRDPFDAHWVPPPIDVAKVRRLIGAVQDISDLSDAEVIQLKKEIRILYAIAHELSKEENIEELIGP